jgi:hypothetical protein
MSDLEDMTTDELRERVRELDLRLAHFSDDVRSLAAVAGALGLYGADWRTRVPSLARRIEHHVDPGDDQPCPLTEWQALCRGAEE